MQLTQATIDPLVTTLGLTPDRIEIAGNQLFVNVESLTFDTTTFARINLNAVSVLLGDINLDGAVDFLDIAPFISVLAVAGFQAEADIDQNGVVDFLDITPLIDILAGL